MKAAGLTKNDLDGQFPRDVRNYYMASVRKLGLDAWMDKTQRDMSNRTMYEDFRPVPRDDFVLVCKDSPRTTTLVEDVGIPEDTTVFPSERSRTHLRRIERISMMASIRGIGYRQGFLEIIGHIYKILSEHPRRGDDRWEIIEALTSKVFLILNGVSGEMDGIFLDDGILRDAQNFASDHQVDIGVKGRDGPILALSSSGGFISFGARWGGDMEAFTQVIEAGREAFLFAAVHSMNIMVEFVGRGGPDRVSQFRWGEAHVKVLSKRMLSKTNKWWNSRVGKRVRGEWGRMLLGTRMRDDVLPLQY